MAEKIIYPEYTPEFREQLKTLREERSAEIYKIPHKPVLINLNEKNTDSAVKVEDFVYAEEDFYHPLNKYCKTQGLELTLEELDTKILRFLFPELDFNAYSFSSGGMSIDDSARVSGRLYRTK